MSRVRRCAGAAADGARLNFKGAGWYVNDYAPKSGSSEGSSAGSDSDSKAESKSDSKSDSKSESKAEAGSGAKESKPLHAERKQAERTGSLVHTCCDLRHVARIF